MKRNQRLQNTFTPAQWEKSELVAYIQGENKDKPKELTLDCFDEIIHVKKSANAKNCKMFIHAMGYRNGEPYFLIIKEK
jgi:hypothetical protein